MQMIRFIDNLLQCLLLIDLNKYVGVDESQAQIFGQNDANRAFASTGHTDEGDVGFHSF